MISMKCVGLSHLGLLINTYLNAKGDWRVEEMTALNKQMNCC